MASSPREKRKFFRHPIHVPIKVSIENASSKSSHSSEANDISLGGISFFCKDRIPKGVFLILSIPVNEKIFENIHAKVAYCVEDKRSVGFRTGVEFTDPPSAFKAKLAEEALQILQYQKELTRQSGKDVSEEEAATRWIRRFANHFPI